MGETRYGQGGKGRQSEEERWEREEGKVKGRNSGKDAVWEKEERKSEGK